MHTGRVGWVCLARVLLAVNILVIYGLSSVFSSTLFRRTAHVGGHGCNCTFSNNTSHLAGTERTQTELTSTAKDVKHELLTRAVPKDTSLSAWLNLLATNVPSGKAVDFQDPNWLKHGLCRSQNASCWNHCIPMKGDISKTNCTSATKYELLRPAPEAGHCHASALHAMLDDTFSLLEGLGMNPMLIAGTLLGAYRNGTIIRWTRDADVTYDLSVFERNKRILTERFERLGYNLFFEGVWRVCMSTKHPLATRVYERQRCKDALPGYRAVDVPYVDLYHYKETKLGTVEIEAHRMDMRYTDFFPRSRIELYGMSYKTIANPVAYFESVPYTNYVSEQNTGYK